MTSHSTTTEAALEPCPKCNDCWALQVQEQQPPLLAKTVTCGRCGFRAPFDTWQARIPAPSVAPEVDQATIKRNDSNMEAWREMFDRVTSTTPYSDEQPLRRVIRDANTVIRLLYKEALSLRAPASPVAPQQSDDTIKSIANEIALGWFSANMPSEILVTEPHEARLRAWIETVLTKRFTAPALRDEAETISRDDVCPHCNHVDCECSDFDVSPDMGAK